MTITSGTIQSASVQVRNDADESKKYDIVANVTVNTVENEFGGSNGTGQIQNGNVSLDGTTMATWTKYNNISITYNVSDATKQSEILTAVQEFCEAVSVFASNVTMTAVINE